MKGSSSPIVGAHPSVLRGELVNVSNWAPSVVAFVAFKLSGDVAGAGLTPEAAWSV